MDPVERLRRRTIGLLLAFAASGSALGLVTDRLTGAASPVSTALLLVTLALCTAGLGLHRGGPRHRRVLEEGLFVAPAAVLLVVLHHALHLADDGDQEALALYGVFLWLPLVHVTVFLLHEARPALLRAVGLSVAVLALSLPRAVGLVGPPGVAASEVLLGQLYLAQAALIALLFLFSRLKDRLREAEVEGQRLALLASTDPLTGLANRRRLGEALERELARGRRTGCWPGVVLLDLDDFKRINDTLGHEAGDHVLAEAAAVLRPLLRDGDCLGRWGGEEFLAVVADPSATDARLLAGRLRAALADHVFGPLRVTASLGVALGRPSDTAASLARRADRALYAAKAAGKDRVAVDGDQPVTGDAETGGTGGSVDEDAAPLRR